MKNLLLALLPVAVMGYLIGFLTSSQTNTQLRHEPQTGTPDASATPVMEANSISTDTLTTISDLPTNSLYPRLALWLLDASPSEIHEFWLKYTDRPLKSPALTELILLNWIRHDLQAAIDETTNTEFEEAAWMTWAGLSPEEALKKSLTLGSNDQNDLRVNAVLKAIGRLRPAWLRQNLDQLPDQWMRYRALAEYASRSDSENPRETIEFLRKQKYHIHPGTLSALARENPLEAINLALDLKANDAWYIYSNQPDDLIEAIAEESPSTLDQILSQVKSPEIGNRILLKQFESLIQRDPIAAEAHAQSMPSGWAKQDHLAALGKHFLESDPSKALEIANEILSENGQFGSRSYEIRLPSMITSTSATSTPSSRFLNQLLAIDPQGLIEATLSDAQETSGNYREVGSAWAKRDLPGYAEWVSTKTDTPFYSEAATSVTYQLLKEGYFKDGMEWAESIPTNPDTPSTLINQAYRIWHLSEPEQAQTWRESAKLSEPQIQSLNKIKREK